MGPLGEAGEKFLAQIIGADVNVDFAFGGRAQIASGDDFPLLDEDYGVAGDFDFAEEMGIEKNRRAAISFAADNVPDEVTTHGVEAGSRLIKENQFRLVDQSLRETDALHHAFGKAPETAVAMRSEADEIEISGNTLAQLRRSQSRKAAVKRKEFGGGEPVVETEVFGQEADFAADFDVSERTAEDLGLAAGGFDQAEKHFNGGAFARTVGAKEAEDFSTTDLEGEPAYGDLGTELFAKAGSFYGQVCWQRSSVKVLRRAKFGEA